ncbi:MAG: hypothetical protein A2041_06980 [Bacteroidetes bacterium GWA2_31_9b]|nr:MAG: hypothetical protein A2041_06980 [Bacteroidetes bacterium GWA2_31_9b]
MIRFIIKVILTSVLIVTISEVGKRNSIMAAVYASLPLTTLLAIVWLYLDTKDIHKVSSLSWNVLIAVVPSFVFLISLPLLIKYGFSFWISLSISIILTVIAYVIYVTILKHYGINLF